MAYHLEPPAGQRFRCQRFAEFPCLLDSFRGEGIGIEFELYRQRDRWLVSRFAFKLYAAGAAG